MVHINSFFSSPIARYTIERLFGIAPQSGTARPATATDIAAQAAPIAAVTKAAVAKIDAALLAKTSDAAAPTSTPLEDVIARYEGRTGHDTNATRASGGSAPHPSSRNFSPERVFGESWDWLIVGLRDEVRRVASAQRSVTFSTEDRLAGAHASIAARYGVERADAWLVNEGEAWVSRRIATSQEMLNRGMQRITKLTDQINFLFKVEGQLTKTDDQGFISFGSFTLVYENSRDIGRLSTSNGVASTTQTRVEITSKETGEVRTMDLLNYMKNIYG